MTVKLAGPPYCQPSPKHSLLTRDSKQEKNKT